MLFYYLIFFFVVSFLFVSKYIRIPQKYLLFVIAVVLILIAGLRQTGVDFDSTAYADIFDTFDSPVNYFKDYQYNSLFEPAYYLIPGIIKSYLSLNITWSFLIFAIIGIGLKFIAIPRLTDLVFLSAIVYCGHFFILHDMTQIRAGIASGILLLCIPQIQKRNFFRFLLLLCLGLLFHYSMIIFLPFYFLGSKSINKKVYLSLLFVPYILHFLHVNIITVLSAFKLGIISDKIQLYNDLLELGVYTEINIHNTMFLIQLFTCVVFILKSDLLLENNKYALLLLKIYCIAAASFVIFSNVPVLAFRISELLSIVQIIIIPFYLYIIKPKHVALLIVFGFALLYFSVDLLYLNFLRPYFG
jgi:hypothetical protein